MEAEAKVHQGRNVKTARNWKKVTQKELGVLLGMEQNGVSQLEDKETIDKPTLQKIAEYLEVDINFLETFIPEQCLASFNIEHLEQHDIKNEGGHTIGGIDRIEKYIENSIPVSALTEYFDKIITLEREIANMRVFIAENNLKYNPNNN